MRIAIARRAAPPLSDPRPASAMARRRTLLILPAALLAAPRAASAARARVGEVAALSGSAAALFSGEPPRALSHPAPIMIDDLLTTGPAARLVCRLDGGIV